MSVLFFHEKLTGKKLLALLLAFAGCVMVSGISGEGITWTGFLIGLGSGIILILSAVILLNWKA